MWETTSTGAEHAEELAGRQMWKKKSQKTNKDL